MQCNLTKGDSCKCVADIDECREGNANCSHTCDNTDGGFQCSCPIGMMLDNDLQTCVGKVNFTC